MQFVDDIYVWYQINAMWKWNFMANQLRLKCKMGQKVSAKLFMICPPNLQHTRQFAEDIIWHMMGPNKHGIERKKRGLPLYN